MKDGLICCIFILVINAIGFSQQGLDISKDLEFNFYESIRKDKLGRTAYDIAPGFKRLVENAPKRRVDEALIFNGSFKVFGMSFTAQNRDQEFLDELGRLILEKNFRNDSVEEIVFTFYNDAYGDLSTSPDYIIPSEIFMAFPNVKNIFVESNPAPKVKFRAGNCPVLQSLIVLDISQVLLTQNSLPNYFINQKIQNVLIHFAAVSDTVIFPACLGNYGWATLYLDAGIKYIEGISIENKFISNIYIRAKTLRSAEIILNNSQVEYFAISNNKVLKKLNIKTSNSEIKSLYVPYPFLKKRKIKRNNCCISF